MYPAQTSLIPVQIALVRFLQQGGSWLADYPYWYLGTTPWRYLTGPIVPFVLSLLSYMVPALSLFDLMFFLIVSSYLLSGVGVYQLVRYLRSKDVGGHSRSMALWSGFFYLLGPFCLLIFSYSSGIDIIARSFLPFIMLFWARFLDKTTVGRAVVLILFASLALLIDSMVLAPSALCMAALLVGYKGWKNIEANLRRGMVLLIVAMALATYWYTPKFWLTIWQSPSFGGKPLVWVALGLAKVMPVFLAFGMAFNSGKLKTVKDRALKFSVYIVMVFASLSFFRFLSDPDFWQDWTAYMIELQLGAAIFLGYKAGQLQSKSKRFFIALIYTGCFLTVFYQQIWRSFTFNQNDLYGYQIGRLLSRFVGSEKAVFISGSNVFWVDAFFDVKQVRGGNDRVSVNQIWREYAWEIREGQDPGKTKKAMQALETDCVLVHQAGSTEYYRDFKYPDKFRQIKDLKAVWQDKGDTLYCFSG